MSERRKRKDDTWTKDELSAALHKNNDRPQRREKSSRHSEDRHRRDEKPKERKSKHHDLEKMLDEHEESMGRRKPTDSESHKERSERRKHESHEETDAEWRARKKREKERKAVDHMVEEDRTRRERKHREGDKKHKEERHRERRKVEEDVITKEKNHRDKSERKHHRSEDPDAEKERQRRQRKEEKRRRREMEEEAKEEERKRERRKHKRNQESSESRNHEERTSSKSSKSKEKPPVSETRDADEEDRSEFNYEDEEFEDYEDDFEDADEEEQHSESNETSNEMNAIIRAINEENERVASARTLSSRSEQKVSIQSDEEEEEANRSSRSSLSSLVTTNINFSSGRGRGQGGKIHRKILKRHRDLAALIQLDFVSIDCFELAPVTEYNFYIKSFGSQNTQQVTTQCNDDSLEVEIQTEPEETNESWTQHPQDGAVTSGSAKTSDGDRAHNTPISMMEDSRTFANFLQYANELVETSFMEATLWGGSQSDRRSSLSFCDSSTRFNTNISYLQGRSILLSAFSSGAMAVAFGPASQHFSARIDRKCLVTVWKITDSENPNKVLVCDATPTSCCFSVSSQQLLFVGTDDGCVLAYDLTEPSTMHQTLLLEKKKTNVFRSPTYTTGWRDDTHSSPVVALHPLTQDDSTNQIYSLEESSRICVWLVAEVVSDVDDDVGLVPHGRVKLVRGMVIDVDSSELSTCAQCPDGKTFYVGTEGGRIVSVTRDKRRRVFESSHVGAVSSIAFNPSASELMLSGHEDGSLCLFHVGQAAPLMSWDVGRERVVACDWSNCRSSVFVALDSANHIHVWDLMAIDSAPAASCKLDERALSLCVDQRSKKSTSLLVAFESCDFEVHRLASHFTDSVTSDEAESMTSSILMFA